MQCIRILRSQVKSLDSVISKLSFNQVQSFENRRWFHADVSLKSPRSKVIGDKNYQPYFQDKLAPPRWKHFWLLMMRRKAEIEGEEEIIPRSDRVNWNYEAELLAFTHRLSLNITTDVLKVAFTEPITDKYSGDGEAEGTHNGDLVTTGKDFLNFFINFYIRKVFPLITGDCLESIVVYMTSENLLSDLAQNLGHADLIQSSEFPITPPILKRSFLATIGAILTGDNGRIEAARFISDFVIAEMMDKDIVHDIWRPKNPMKVLVEELKTRKMPSPEIRLTRQSGITTVLPVYFIGIFLDKKLFVESGGETVTKAETDAAKLALKKLYGVSGQRYMPNFNLLDDPNIRQELQRQTHKYDDREFPPKL